MKGVKVNVPLASMLALGLTLTAVVPAAANTVVKATATRRWNPASTSIANGTRVVWKNPTSVSHTVTAYGGGWSKNTTIAANGGHTGFTFNNAGTFKFRCRFHSSVVNGACSGMCGVVKVT